MSEPLGVTLTPTDSVLTFSRESIFNLRGSKRPIHSESDNSPPAKVLNAKTQRDFPPSTRYPDRKSCRLEYWLGVSVYEFWHEFLPSRVCTTRDIFHVSNEAFLRRQGALFCVWSETNSMDSFSGVLPTQNEQPVARNKVRQPALFSCLSQHALTPPYSPTCLHVRDCVCVCVSLCVWDCVCVCVCVLRGEWHSWMRTLRFV